MSRDHVDVWITILAPLLNPALPAEPLKALLLLAPHIRDEFGPNALTPMSAKCVAEAERYGPVPDWGILAKALRAYVRDFVPRQFLPLAAPRQPPAVPPTQIEVDAVARKLTAWQREAAAERAARPSAIARKTTAKHLNSAHLARIYADMGQHDIAAFHASVIGQAGRASMSLPKDAP